MRKKLPRKPKGIVLDFTRTVFDPSRGRPFRGIKPFLREAKGAGYRLFLYAKNGRHDPLHKTHQHGLNELFEGMKLTNNKVPEEVQEIADIAGIHPRELLVVGDRVRTDIASGKGAGSMTAWLQKGKFAEEHPQGSHERPDITINDIEELRTILGLGPRSSVDRGDGAIRQISRRKLNKRKMGKRQRK